MNNLNSVLIEGNLTRDPQIREIPNGSTVCNFTIASNRYYKKDREKRHEVSYLDIEAWAQVAVRCHEYLKKGRGVRVVGRLQQDRWEDDSGQKHSRLKIVAEHVEFKPRNMSSNKAEGQGAEQPAEKPAKQADEASMRERVTEEVSA